MQSPPLNPETVTLDPLHTLQTVVESGSNAQEIAAVTAAGYHALYAYIGAAGVQPLGPPLSLCVEWTGDRTRSILAVPIPPLPEEAPTLPEILSEGELPGGSFLRFTHRGPYEGLWETYNAITAWLVSEGHMESPADWGRFMPTREEYPTDPDTTPAEDLVTWIELPWEAA